ncbi:TlpA disulfide reductase family protein [Cytophagaceae bacterium ABcell3]|nr:TlpA disulfide reductase family protein [Cytophagaceae bacterium ABcell3]
MKLSLKLFTVLVALAVIFSTNVLEAQHSKDDEGFTLRDIDGKNVSLSDFKGKVVFIDYWATWCMPCLVEINKSKYLKEHYADADDVVFLYVSIDKDEEKWKKMVEKKGIEGTHLISLEGKEDNLLQKFGIEAIPRFMLVDKSGKIVDFDARNPSDKKIIKDIDKLRN